jgi:hypothetical protein
MSLNGSGLICVYLTVFVIEACPRSCCRRRVSIAVGERIAGRVAQHVDVHRERQFRRNTSAFDHPSDAHTPERLTSLIDEHIRGFGRLLALQALEVGQLVALQIMCAVVAILEAPDDDRPPCNVDVVSTQVA